MLRMKNERKGRESSERGSVGASPRPGRGGGAGRFWGPRGEVLSGEVGARGSEAALGQICMIERSIGRSRRKSESWEQEQGRERDAGRWRA